MSYVYLIHFHSAIAAGHTTQHYLGSCADLAIRIQQHAAGCGARLVAVATERGIGFDVVRVWRGGRELERRLKRWKCGPDLCPVCRERPRPVRAAEEMSAAEIDAALLPF